MKNEQHDSCYRRCGFTIVEMLVVVGVIAIVASLMIGVAGYVKESARKQETEGTIRLLTSALEEFKMKREGTKYSLFPSSPYGYWLEDGSPTNRKPWYRDYLNNILISINVIDTNMHIPRNNQMTCCDEVNPVQIFQDGKYQEASVSIEVMYYTLNQLKESRAILEKMPGSVMTNRDNDWNNNDVNLFEVNDAWGNPLRYRTFGAGNYPQITSAGSDMEFDTADDIISTEI